MGLLRQNTRGLKTKRQPRREDSKTENHNHFNCKEEGFVAALADQAVLLRSIVWVGGGPVRTLLTKLSGTVPIGLPARVA